MSDTYDHNHVFWVVVNHSIACLEKYVSLDLHSTSLHQYLSFTFPIKQRFIQYLASRSTLFNLNNFVDKGALQGKETFNVMFINRSILTTADLCVMGVSNGNPNTVIGGYRLL